MPDIFVNSEKQNESVPPVIDATVKPAGFNLDPSNQESLPNHTHNPLSAYCYMPHNVGFINKEPDEKVILLVRRHFITNFGWILLVLLMLFAPLILNYFPLLAFLPLKFQILAILFWYLLTLAIFIQG